MPLPRTVVIADQVRQRLAALIRAGSSPQALVFRCRIVLRAADPDGPANLQIAAELDCDRHTVGQWRNRFLKHGLAGLQDAPRSGRPRSFSPRPTAGSRHAGDEHHGRA